MSVENITERWNEIKVLVESLEQDVAKNVSGNTSAGVRARRGLRLLKKEAADLVKLTLEVEKSRKAS
jgi:predicted transcriptional regulator|tara:strand:+ start:522 stop:722 length:201 start_codon:yes stop_codon:yes gene_type:complete